MVSLIVLGNYIVVTRVDRNDPARTPDERQRVGIVLFGVWLALSVILTLHESGWDLARWQLYAIAIAIIGAAFGVIWLKRKFDSRM